MDDTSNPFIARDNPSPDESMVVIRFAKPKGIDFQYLLNMIAASFMSRANTIVVPGDKMELAMQLIFTPFVWRMMERRKRALGAQSDEHGGCKRHARRCPYRRPSLPPNEVLTNGATAVFLNKSFCLPTQARHHEQSLRPDHV